MPGNLVYGTDMETTTHPSAHKGEKEATMAATHTTTVTCVTAAPFGGGTYELRCTCGEVVRYSGENFTRVEAQRHQAWHAKAGK
jgi:hypothetical protein